MIRFLFLSFLLHLVILLPWLIKWSKGPLPLSGRGGGGSVNITVIGTGDRHVARLRRTPRDDQRTPLPPGMGRGTGASGAGSGEEGNDPLLAIIRARIEQHKRYPLLAKKSGVEGKALVHFEISSDGTLKSLNLSTSSGSKILDEEALQTIRRSVPFPFYPQPLEVWIRYEK